MGLMYQRIAEVAELVRKHTGFRLHDVKPQWFHTPAGPIPLASS